LNLLRHLPILLLLGLLGPMALATEGRIIKVLPHLLDREGHHALSPSLYERDAYQAELRKHPDKVSGLRFDVHWKARHKGTGNLTLRLQLRTAARSPAEPLVLETKVKSGLFGGGWAALALDGETYKKSGEVRAWRATLLDGETEIAESKSFLW
jgi:hypothetical protein